MQRLIWALAAAALIGLAFTQVHAQRGGWPGKNTTVEPQAKPGCYNKCLSKCGGNRGCPSVCSQRCR